MALFRWQTGSAVIKFIKQLNYSVSLSVFNINLALSTTNYC